MYGLVGYFYLTGVERVFGKWDLSVTRIPERGPSGGITRVTIPLYTLAPPSPQMNKNE